MNPGNEVVSPATEDPAPQPAPPDSPATAPSSTPPPSQSPLPVPTPPRPTADVVLRWVAAAGPEPWFPSAHAKKTGTPRDGLDDPLTDLRLAGLIRVAAWVKGAGQGYVLTPEGEATLADAAALALVGELSAAATDGPDEQPAEPNPRLADGATVIDRRPPLVTPVVLALNLLWFFAGLVIALRSGVPLGRFLVSGDTEVLLRTGAVSGPELLRGGWWRLAASCFVHVGGIHLLVNLLTLGAVGPLAELAWGRQRLLAVYAVSGLAGGCLAMGLHPVGPDGTVVVLAGASGALSGVLTALVAWLLLVRAYLPADLVGDLARRLAAALVLAVAVSLVPGVSWEAHLGGGVAGFLAAGLLNALRFGDRPRRVAAAVLLAALPVLCVGGLLAAMHSGDRWAALRQRLVQQEQARRGEAFEREVRPLLEAIKPEAVRPLETAAGLLLIRDPARRGERAAALRARAEELREKAAEVQDRVSGPPTGHGRLDQLRERAGAYAAARGRALELLVRMLDGNEIPTTDAWKAWGTARREADRLWDQLVPPKQ